MRFSMKSSFRWSLLIALTTFFIAASLSVISAWLLEGVSWALGLMVVFVFIFVGVVFDMIGIATASAVEVPFHAMASKKVFGSRQAIRIVRNADRVSNFCNDVVGDICGIMSGAASAVVVIQMVNSWDMNTPLWEAVVGVIMTGFVSACTVGFKALGKSFAIHYATEIVFQVGKIIHWFELRFTRTRVATDQKVMQEKRGNSRDTE